MNVAALAQPTYNLIGSQTVDECEGYLLDSNAGENGEDYGHNEDYEFTICIPNATSIEISFFEFLTEQGNDYMTFHDGADINAPQIGPAYSYTNIPPTITSSSGCLTIHWVSDASVAIDGWFAYWEAEIEEPEPPVVTFNPTSPTCSTEVITMLLDYPIPCDSVYPGAFTVSGGQTISNITAQNCTNGEGSVYELTLNPGLDESMTYDLGFVYNYTDDCENVFSIDVQGSLIVNDCPLQVEVLEDATTICEGDCIEIWAEVSGGDPNSYSFAWSNGLPNSAGPHLVCPTTTTSYTVTVSDAGPAASASDQTTITVIPPPSIDPIPDVCQNNGQIAVTASPSGGSWSGTHISDPNPIFRPDSGWGNPWTYYTDLNGCTDSVQSQVYQVWAGFDQSACPGEPPFQLTNGIPAGGTWSGPFTTPDGIFNPSTPSIYNIIYTTADGCTDTKVVRVETITMPPDLTVCESDPQFNLAATPFGGTWSGPGVANWYWGTYRPADAGPGTHVINYEIVGCSATMNVTVTEIDAGGNYTICPEEPPIQLNGNPAGGTWSGIGVSSTGLYDPTIAPSVSNDTVMYSVGGCTDTRVIYVRQTTIQLSGLEFCLYDDALTLNWLGIQRFPGGGTWSGPGTDNIGAGNFTPASAGGGTHTLYYEANTCIDSTILIVNENTMHDTSICEFGNPIQLIAQPTGGSWTGSGITDPIGIFDPQQVGIGQHYVYYQAPSGCWDSCMVDVYQLQPADIAGLDNAYCFIDSSISIIATPFGGMLTGPGITDTIFNPAHAGPGLHEIVYTQGTAGCEVTTDLLVSISDSISTTLVGHYDAICLGDPVTVGVEASGGDGTFFTYAWEPNVSFFATQELYPIEDTKYFITTSDGCSKPVLDSVQVFVFDPFSVDVETSSAQCYGNTGYISVRGNPASPFYEYEWSTNPVTYDPTVFGDVGQTFSVSVTDPKQGNCTFDTSITIPALPNVTAFFTPNPNGSCLLESDPVAEFIDLSQGASSGLWDFGDGATEDYTFGQYPVHEYADTGSYTVSLYVENIDGSCTDEYQFDVCVQPEFKLWIPNAFTPDGDGLNDYFEIVSSGIIEFELLISSSWGHKIYRMTSIEDPPWDGTYKGKPVQQDRYIYEVIAKGRHLGGVRFHKGSGYIHVIRHEE